MMKMPKLMAAAGAALLALLIAGAALAQTTPGTPNHAFWGFDVTIDGEPATDQARIIAMADGKQVGSANYDPGTGWSIDVTGGTTGVTFMVMVDDTEYATGETRDATPGGNTPLTLAATSAMTMPETEDDGGDLEGGDSGTGMMDDGDDTGMMDDGDLEGGDSGTGMMDDGDSTGMMDDGDDTGMMDDGGDTGMTGDDEDPPGTVGGATGLPDNGTGGLADSSRGVSTAVYGGIAGALALIALVGGVAIRRRAQS